MLIQSLKTIICKHSAIMVCLLCITFFAQDFEKIPSEKHLINKVDVFLSAEKDKFIGRPTKIIASNKNLYFSDHAFQQITRVNSLGKKNFTFGSQGEGPGEFSSPSGFWVFNENYLVYDYNRNKFITYDRMGNMVDEVIINKNPVNPNGFPPNIPLTLHALSPNKLLIPSRGKNGSLFGILDINSMELILAGNAVGEHVESYNDDEVYREFSKGEIPKIFLNMIALESSSTAIYSFQQTTGILEKYSFSGKLIWKKKITIPSQSKLFEWISSNNQEIDPRNNSYHLFHYAWAIDANEYGVALLLNLPEREPVTAAWIPADGSEMKLLSFPGLSSNVLGLFGIFSLSPDNSRVYFLNKQDGIIYTAEWPI
jgi:hypothetical protein